MTAAFELITSVEWASAIVLASKQLLQAQANQSWIICFYVSFFIVTAGNVFDLHCIIFVRKQNLWHVFGRYWITNGAVHARHAVVFAQLVIAGVGYGVHTVIVPVRDRDMRPLPGVTVVDMGVKMGLNGVDNARLRFDNVRVPRLNLLNRSVVPDYDYIPSEAPNVILNILVQNI